MDPARLLLVDGRDGGQLRAGEIDLLLRRGLAWLRAQGLRPGDSFPLVAEPELEPLLLGYAALLGGVVPELRLPGSGPVPELGEAWSAGPLAEPGDPDPDAVALRVPTSGSTGAARPVALSHRRLDAGVRRGFALSGAGPGDRYGLPMLFHTVTGFRGALFSPLLSGAGTVLLPPGEPALHLLDRADEQGVSLLHAGPGFVRAVLREPGRLRRPRALRMVIVGGAALGAEEKRAFCAALGVRLVHAYGLTETGGVIAAAGCGPGDPGPPGVGPPVLPVRIREADAAGVGELEVDAEGWVATGDLARLDREGNLHLFGRRERVYTSASGEKLFLDLAEGELRERLGRECALVPLADPRRGAVLGLWVEGGLAGVDALLAGWLPAARPRRRRAGPLPRLSNGKVDLVAVRAGLEQEEAADPAGLGDEAG